VIGATVGGSHVINGAHVIIYSTDPEQDRGFFRDILGLGNVDVGGGWLIFGLPPAELAVHPAEKNDTHELYLMCEDVEGLIARMRARAIECSPVESLGWGLRTRIRLPGGGLLGVYQPRHARPPANP
jgi:catechol 2,3-dioxygenase-like lactoylglutathione lyase family enzyme